MHRRVRWLVTAVAFVAVLAAAVCFSRRPPVRVPLFAGAELRILKVSLGTNHIFSAETWWKRALRGVLPDPWQKPLGPFQGVRFQTRHESLVVWMDGFHPPTGKPVETLLEQFEAVLPDGSVAKGRNRRAWSGVAVEFPWFAREARQVPLQVRAGSDFIPFLVDNPRPACVAPWTTRTLPQTCEVARTEIALLGVLPGRRFGRFEEPADAVVQARGLGAGCAGWMAWRVTAFDPWGNWSEGDWNYGSGFLRVPPLPANVPIWMLSFEAQEYLSAGFVPPPTNGNFLVLPLEVRARELGARFVMFAGPGAYRVTNGQVCCVEGSLAGGSSRPSVWFSSVTGETNWAVELRTPAAGILCLSDGNPSARSLQVRLRERVGSNSGRVFWAFSVTNAGARLNGTNRLATFHAPRLPAVTTNLEVELMATLPAAEFFVTPAGR